MKKTHAIKPGWMSALAAATLAMPASAALVANYTFDSGTFTGTAVTNLAPGTAYDGTLQGTTSIDTTTPLSGTGSLLLDAPERMTIDGSASFLEGWKGIDVEATVNLASGTSFTGQNSIINIGHFDTSTNARFRFTVRDSGKLFAGLRFSELASGTFMSFYARDAAGADIVLSAATSYDVGVEVLTNGLSTGTVKFRYKAAGSPEWILANGVRTSATSGWADGWFTGKTAGAAVGSNFPGGGEQFSGRIDNLSISQIPEPSGMALLGLGGLLLVRRKR